HPPSEAAVRGAASGDVHGPPGSSPDRSNPRGRAARVAQRRARRTAAVSCPDLLLESFAETIRAANAALESPSAGPDGDRRLIIAGVRVQLRFAGPRLAQILDPAFGHLSRPAPSPADGAAPEDDLVVTLIDGGLFGPPPLAAQ